MAVMQSSQSWRPCRLSLSVLACSTHPVTMSPQMKLANKPGAAQPVAATVTLDTFLHNFSVPKLMDKIADLEQHNLRAKIAAMSRPQNQQSTPQQKSPAAVQFVQDLQLVDKLLISFQRRAMTPTLLVHAKALEAVPSKHFKTSAQGI